MSKLEDQQHVTGEGRYLRDVDELMRCLGSQKGAEWQRPSFEVERDSLLEPLL